MCIQTFTKAQSCSGTNYWDTFCPSSKSESICSYSRCIYVVNGFECWNIGYSGLSYNQSKVWICPSTLFWRSAVKISIFGELRLNLVDAFFKSFIIFLLICHWTSLIKLPLIRTFYINYNGGRISLQRRPFRGEEGLAPAKGSQWLSLRI